MATQPDECCEQRQRRRKDRAHRRLYARRNGALPAAQEALTRKLVTELNGLRQPVLRDLQRAVFRRRDDGVAAPHRRRDRRNRARAAGAAPHRAEHRERVGADQRSAPGRVDLQFPLRYAAVRGRDELRSQQGHRRRRDRVPGHGGEMRRIEPKGGSSSWRAAGSTTTSTIRSLPARKPGRLRFLRRSPAAAEWPFELR